MYLFSLFAVPLSYLLFSNFLFGKSNKAGNFFAGLLWAVPSVIILILLRSIFAPQWGTNYILFSFLIRFWLIPFVCLIIAMLVMHGFSTITKEQGLKEVTKFSFGFMSLFGIAQTILSWGTAGFVFSIVSPLLIVASAFFFVFVAEKIVVYGIPIAFAFVLALIAFFFAAAFAIMCFFINLEWLGWSLLVILLGLSLFLSIKRFLTY